MTNSEAIEVLKANYPDPCFGQLRDAVNKAIYVLSAEPDYDKLHPKADPNFSSCLHCVYSKDSVEICILRRCIHAPYINQMKECYVERRQE